MSMELVKKDINYGLIDKECIRLCDVLNSLPYCETFESCCGHGKYTYKIWFKCLDLTVLGRLSRAVAVNYSDGQWEIVSISTDTTPVGVFELRTKEILNVDELDKSINGLIDNILYWTKDEFDEYFKI